MESHNPSSEVVAALCQQVDPLVLLIDAGGHVVMRYPCRNPRFPADVREAPTLQSFLSAPVCREWMRLVELALRDAQGSATAIVILDGLAHQLVCVRRASTQTPDATSAVAWLCLLPWPVGSDEAAPAPRHVLTQHEWGHLEPLSRGQLDTLRHLTIGLGNEEIAKKVNRTKRAVEWHIRHLNQQLGASGRERLAMIGRDAGLHCFGDQAWQQILRTRPARRHVEGEETPDHAHETADSQGSAVA